MYSAGLQFFIIAGQVEYEKGVCRLAGITRSQLVGLYLKTEFYCHLSFKTLISHDLSYYDWRILHFFFFFETVAEILVVFKSVNFICHWRYFQIVWRFLFSKIWARALLGLKHAFKVLSKISYMCYIFHNKQTPGKQFHRSKGLWFYRQI